MRKLAYLLCIILVAICLTGCNDKKENVSTSNNSEQKELTSQEKYNKAMTLLESDEKSAIELLKEISDFQDSKTYIDNYEFKHRFDGTYSDKDSSKLSFERRYIVNGFPTKIISYQYKYSESVLGDNKYSVGYFNDFENILSCNEDYTICTSEDNNYSRTYNFYSDKMIVNVHNKKPQSWEKHIDMEDTYYKISDSTDLPEKREIIGSAKPKIGMTAQEVRNSSWGSPKKINTDTYSWGTKEQWVYDNGYIYFENGIVTSISESKE